MPQLSRICGNYEKKVLDKEEETGKEGAGTRMPAALSSYGRFRHEPFSVRCFFGILPDRTSIGRAGRIARRGGKKTDIGMVPGRY